MATIGTMCMRSANRMAIITRSCLFRTPNLRSEMRSLTTASETNSKPAQPPTDGKPPTETNSNRPETPEENTGASEAELKLKEANTKLEENVKDMKVPGLFHRLWPKERVRNLFHILWPFRRKYVSQDKYMRSLAETENVRQRMKKQVEDAKMFGIQGFCKDLLEVADVLGKATTSVPKEELTDENIHLKNLFQGLTMTETQLLNVFNKHGLKQIAPEEGEKFDPFIHEALFEVPTPDKDAASTIATITKVGYKLNDRTIRPALVGVFKSS